MNNRAGDDQHQANSINNPQTTKAQLNSEGHDDNTTLSEIAELQTHPSGSLVMPADSAESLPTKSGRPSPSEIVKLTNPLGVQMMTFAGETGKKRVVDYRSNKEISASACLVLKDDETNSIYQAKAVYQTGTVCRTAWYTVEEGNKKWTEYQGFYKKPLSWSKGDKLA